MFKSLDLSMNSALGNAATTNITVVAIENIGAKRIKSAHAGLEASYTIDHVQGNIAHAY